MTRQYGAQASADGATSATEQATEREDDGATDTLDELEALRRMWDAPAGAPQGPAGGRDRGGPRMGVDTPPHPAH